MKEKIDNVIFNEKEINEILNNMDKILNRINKLANTSDAIDNINNFNKLRDHYLTLYWISYVGYLKDIKDEKYLKSEEIFGKADSVYNNLIYKYYSCLLKLKNNEQIVGQLGNRVFELANNQSKLFSDDEGIQDLASKEKELCKNYQKIIISTKFEFNGETINLSQLAKYYKDNDRALRKNAFDKRFEVLIELMPEIDKIVDQLIDTRNNIAIRLGLKNYTEYGFIKMNRIGYTEDDLKVFKNNVIKYFVPISQKLYDSQKQRLGLKEFDYYDEAILFSDGNAKIEVPLDELINKLKNTFNEMNLEISDLFCNMLDEGLIDLADRENKSSGGLTTYFPDYGYPTFIKKYLGLEENLTSIFHEFGHCTQLYYSGNQKYHENRWPTFDICEIHSTSMELLAYPYLKDYFNDNSNKYCVRHLTGLINVIIQMCATDDFECELYKNPEMKSSSRNELWKKTAKQYCPYKHYDHAYFNLGISWQADTNRITDPFYGIDYSLASICALSFYKEELLNKSEALAKYIDLCKDGGSLSLKEIIYKYSLDNPFNEQDIEKLSEFIDKEITCYLENLK